MQPYLFPYIGYFQLINAVDKFVLFDDVNYINKGWINRNNILMNGRAHLFTFPLKEASQNKLICQIELMNDRNWKDKFLKTISQSYKKSEYYSDVFPVITEILNFESVNLSDYIYNSITKINNYLGIGTEIVKSSAKYNNCSLKAQNRIINICEQELAVTYINPIGGVDLYDKKMFAESGIDLFFLKTNSIEYKQYDNGFVPWLSIIDILMFNSRVEARALLNEYELI